MTRRCCGCGCGCNRACGGPRTRSSGQYDPMRRARLPHDSGGNPEQRGARAGSQKSPRWSAERRAFLPTVGKTHGAQIKRAPPCRSWHGVTGGTQPPGRLRRSVAPHRVANKEEEKEGRNGNDQKIKSSVGWAIRGVYAPSSTELWAHAEQSTTFGYARSRAPCPRRRLYR